MNLDPFIKKIRPKNRFLLDDLHIPEGPIFKSPYSYNVFYQSTLEYYMQNIKELTYGVFDKIRVQKKGKGSYNVNEIIIYYKDIKPIAKRVHFILNLKRKTEDR